MLFRLSKNGCFQIEKMAVFLYMGAKKRQIGGKHGFSQAHVGVRPKFCVNSEYECKTEQNICSEAA